MSYNNPDRYISDAPEYYVYVLCRPDRTPFYVGHGRRGRAYSHLRERDNSAIQSIVREIYGQGGRMFIRFAHINLLRGEAMQIEKELIARHDATTVNLLHSPTRHIPGGFFRGTGGNRVLARQNMEAKQREAQSNAS